MHGAERDDELAAARRAERERLLRGGSNDFPKMCSHVLEGAHPSNIICVRLVPGAERVITGSGDSTVRAVSFDGQLAWATQVGSGAVLSLDVQPSTSGRPEPERLAVASCMDGSTHVLHASSGALLASSKPHGKYVVRAAWSGDGSLVASGSHDESVVLQRLVAGQGYEVGEVAADHAADPPGVRAAWLVEALGGHLAECHPRRL